MSETQHSDKEPLANEASIPPSTPRRENRIAAMQFLYTWEAGQPKDLAEAALLFFGTREKPRDFYAFGEELALGAVEKMPQIDEVIRAHARNWTFSRIAKVDLAILRLALYELLFRKDIPPVVTINEAIEISKSFSGPDAKRFINGILDKVKETLPRPARSPAQD